jgi:signal transduction histidine kinase
MIKSVFMRKIVGLILAAVLLAGVLSAVIYILVTQRLYTNIQAQELTPIARTIADLVATEGMTESQDTFTANQQDKPDQNMLKLLDRDNKNFLGASLHIYDESGETRMEPKQRMHERDGGPEESFDEETDTLIAAELEKVLAGEEVSVVRKSTAGLSYLVVGVPIQEGTTTIGAVIFTKGMSELNETMSGLYLTLLISTLVAFAAMLVPAYIATKRLMLPIRQMQQVAQAMAAGDFSVRADTAQKGEIGELGRSMNHFAEESARLEQTRRDYVANVSHELRTPIASIRAIGETLRDGMAKTETKKELFYNNIVRESLRLSRLVDDLLELSRLQAGTEAMQKYNFDLREVLQNIYDIFGHLAMESNVSLKLSADLSNPIPVCSNADRLEQVLVILMDNAIKHTPENGAILLAVEESQGKLELWVSNTGVGIPAEDLPYIFERFYKVDKSHSGYGTGLGLSIAKEIVKGLGGQIFVESEAGNTKFTFTV